MMQEQQTHAEQQRRLSQQLLAESQQQQEQHRRLSQQLLSDPPYGGHGGTMPEAGELSLQQMMGGDQAPVRKLDMSELAYSCLSAVAKPAPLQLLQL